MTGNLKKIYLLLSLKHYLFIFILCGILGFLFIFFFRETSNLTVTVYITEQNPLQIGSNPPYWLAEALKAGSKEKDASGKVKAEVVSVISYPVEGDRRITFFTVKLETVFNPKQNQHSFKGRSVAVGSPIELSLDGVFLEGVVTQTQSEQEIQVSPSSEKIVSAKLLYEFQQQGTSQPGVDDWIPNSFSVGDEMKDSTGKIIAQVISKNVQPADLVFTTNDGQVLVKKHPFKKVVDLRLKVQVKNVAGTDYFLDSIPIRVGNDLPLFLPQITISPTIMTISEAGGI